MTTKVFTVAEMVAAERAADASGISYEQMMETAGRQVAWAIKRHMAIGGKSILVLVGPGNNGGDGLVAGRYLAEGGARVAFYLFKTRDTQADENYRLVEQKALPVVCAENDKEYRVLRKQLGNADIIVDGLLGTGVTRAISGNLATLMEIVKREIAAREGSFASLSLTDTTGLEPALEESLQGETFKKPTIVAIDCPSGLNCDTGELDPLAIAADLTVTFAGPKRGHFRFPGASACGELVVADIGIPASLSEVSMVNVSLVTPVMARTMLPERPRDGHKGTFGTALIAAGSEHYWGAPVLAGQGALRAGAGLVALAVPEYIRPTTASQLPEAIYPPVPAQRVLDGDSARFLFSTVNNVQAVLAGPGLGPAAGFVESLLLSSDTLPPLVLDADALNILAALAEWPTRLPANTILTPHPGEMARLTGRPATELKELDRVELAIQSAAQWGHIVLLKGAYSVVAAPDGRCAIVPFANPLLAVGGSGDVLAGVIAALLAQGLPAYDAAVLGAYLHGAAGELAAEEYGDSGMLAGEIAARIPKVRKRLLAG